MLTTPPAAMRTYSDSVSLSSVSTVVRDHDLSFLAMLAGDVEVNPGPTPPARTVTPAKADKSTVKPAAKSTTPADKAKAKEEAKAKEAKLKQDKDLLELEILRIELLKKENEKLELEKKMLVQVKEGLDVVR